MCETSEPEPGEFVAHSDARGRFEALGDLDVRSYGLLPLPWELTRHWTLCVHPASGPVFASTLYSDGPGVPRVARYACELDDADLTCRWERLRPPAPVRW